jgi:amino acid transporter
MMTLLNIIGVKPVAVFQILLVMVMLITGIIFVLGGFAFGRLENMTPAFEDIKGAGMVLLMTPSMYIGFDMVAKSGEEMNMPLKAISKVLIVSIVAAVAWYVLIIIGFALSAPVDFRQQLPVPIADSAAYAFQSPIMAKVMIIGGICGIVTCWNGFIVGASRIIFAMGRAKMLPAFFGWVHPKYQTPVYSIVFVGFICCCSPLLGENALIWLIDTAAFGTVIAYLMVSISYLRIRRKEPELIRRYNIKRGKTVGMAAMIISAFFLVWYTPISPITLRWPYEWGLVLSWIFIGIILLIVSRIADRKQKVTDAERELLMFGEEYAREKIVSEK